jgi:ABC-2 type transport system permease protein
LNAPAGTGSHVPASRVFLAMLNRDMRVARREIGTFVIRTALQPLLITVVFGFLLPRMGFMRANYTAALLPGVIGICLAFASLQAVALPMITDFGFTREIDDRLLSPVPIEAVAFEKVVSGTIQGAIAGAIVLPIARLLMGPIPGLSFDHVGTLIAMVVLGAFSFSSLGLLLGTAVEGPQIGLLFSMILAPMITFGCAYYPWAALHVVPALQWGVLVNPLVYVSEGLRAALTPHLPHMPTLPTLFALLAVSAVFGWLGLGTFRRRALS